MSSETSDIDVKVSLDIQHNANGVDRYNTRIIMVLERKGDALHATVQGLGFDESDYGASAIAEVMDLVSQGIQTALTDKAEPTLYERAVQELMKSGLDEGVAREAATTTLGLAGVELFPQPEPMHPQDPERWVSDGKPDIHSFETPQHVRDARAARKKARGFKPTPVVRKDKD